MCYNIKEEIIKNILGHIQILNNKKVFLNGGTFYKHMWRD